MKNDNQTPKSKNTERKTKVLLEEISHSVKTVAEGHSVIVRKLEEHDGKFTDIARKLDGHDARFTKIESELNSVKMAVMDVNHKVGTLEEKLDRSLENHEKRLVKLEEKVPA